MIRSITNGLGKIASLRVIGIFLLLFIVSVTVINGKPYGVAQLNAITGGAGIPDMEMTGYSPQRAYDILTAQGEAGRAFYLHFIVPQDFPFPLIYSLFYAVTLIYLAQKLFPNNPQLQQIGLMGLCAGLADWGENLCLITLLLNYPQRLDAVAMVACVFTIIKAILTLLNMVIILAGVSWMLVGFVRGKIQGHTK
ncbi:MAG: hypothetical protein JXA21_25570 [Anaerolineae bacterium]|nr:hypothetical protein [Anaerolineae bacterium]